MFSDIEKGNGCQPQYKLLWLSVTPVSEGQNRAHSICVPGSISTHMLTSQVQYCWGEGEHATLRSKPLLPHYTNEDHAQASRGRRSDEDRRGCLCPLHCKTKARLHRSLLVPCPHRVRRPMWDLAHCNGPRADKHVTGRVCNSLFCNDGL
jgi:hypothetical protein